MNQTKKAKFQWVPFSLKQKKVLTWWMEDSPVKDKDGIICDGSVRAGKTLVMSFSFVIWAMETFEYQNLIMAGKSIGSFRRNVLALLKIVLKLRGYSVKDKRADNMIIVKHKGVTNFFYIFGGKDERSQDLVQGITAAGAYLDEVALMPESFVNQALARCSVEGAKFWFNCNPQGPYHWFKINFLDKLKEKSLLHLHFTMDDNPSLSDKVKDRYRRWYNGVFYQRFILGLWVVASGIIYDMFDELKHVIKTEQCDYKQYYVGIDYGTYNAMAMGLYGSNDNKHWVKIKEYHYSGRDENRQKTDEEYYQDLVKFIGALTIQSIIIDPSAASFIAAIRKHGQYSVRKAKNDVLEGIRNVGTAISNGQLMYNDCCIETIKELRSYMWDQKAAEHGEDKPVKENDHHMDADRYFINTAVFRQTYSFK